MTDRGEPPPAQASMVEAQPSEAAAVFGAALPRAERYVALLAGAGVERGLVGPREPGRLWTRHVLNSAALAGLIPPHADVLDVGSGAGLPGIPLALARPDLRMTLLEPMQRRIDFLIEVVQTLDLKADVRRGRAEDIAPRSTDAVVARAVAPLSRLAAMTLPLLRPGGRLLALKGSGAAAEVADAKDVLDQWPVATVSLVAAPAGADTATVVVVVLHDGKSTVKDRER